MTDIGIAVDRVRSQALRPKQRVPAGSPVNQAVSESARQLLKIAIQYWNFPIGTFTIQHWRSHVIFHSRFLACVYQFPLEGEKNINRFAGLLKQGG